MLSVVSVVTSCLAFPFLLPALCGEIDLTLLVGKMKLSDFQYELPEDRIAKYPAKPRDASRLLVLPPSGPFLHSRFRALPSLLNEGDVLVVNDTRVVHARLLGRRPGGGERFLSYAGLGPGG